MSERLSFPPFHLPSFILPSVTFVRPRNACKQRLLRILTCHRGEETGKQEAPLAARMPFAPHQFLEPREKKPAIYGTLFTNHRSPRRNTLLGIRTSHTAGLSSGAHTRTARVGCSQSTGGSPSHWRAFGGAARKNAPRSRRAKRKPASVCPVPFLVVLTAYSRMRPCFFFAVWGGKHMLR